MKQTSVIIVGAGPVGLSLALGLARNGHDVLVLEKKDSIADHSRAPVIWPGTQHVLASLGVLDAFVERSIVMRQLALWNVDAHAETIRFDLGELDQDTPYARLLILPQSETERLLCEALERQPTARVRFSAEVTNLDLSKDDTVRVSWQGAGTSAVEVGRFVVGCDGAHSTVRSQVAAKLEGETYDARAALADVRLKEDGELAFPRIWTRGGIAIGIRISADVWRLIIPRTDSREPSLELQVERAARHLFPNVESSADYAPVWQSEFRLHRRLSSRFVHSRTALAGDAAHLNSPVGGQGMNSGIQDAALLTRVLANALNADDPARLAEYECRREQIRSGVNAFTDKATRLLLGGSGRRIELALKAVGFAMRVPSLRRKLLRRIAMTDGTFRD